MISDFKRADDGQKKEKDSNFWSHSHKEIKEKDEMIFFIPVSFF